MLQPPESRAACQGQTAQGAQLNPCAQRVQGTRAMPLVLAWFVLRGHWAAAVSKLSSRIRQYNKLKLPLVKGGCLPDLVEHVLLCSVVEDLVCLQCICVGYCQPVSTCADRHPSSDITCSLVWRRLDTRKNVATSELAYSLPSTSYRQSAQMTHI
jgi:hypothetical protein